MLPKEKTIAVPIRVTFNLRDALGVRAPSSFQTFESACYPLIRLFYIVVYILIFQFNIQIRPEDDLGVSTNDYP